MSGYLVVRSGDGAYGFRLADVIEVAESGTVVPVPAGHRALRGVTPVREHYVPLVHLQALLGGREVPASVSAAVVLMRCDQRRVAFEVDEVRALVHEDALPVPAGTRIPLAAGVARFEGTLIPILDPRALLERLAGAGAS